MMSCHGRIFQISRSLHYIVIAVAAIAIIVALTACGSSGTRSTGAEEPVPMYKLYLDIRSETNLFFSTYDITIALDGQEVGAVSNGKEFTYLAEVTKGKHTLTFCKSGETSPSSEEIISVSGDMTFSCDLGHNSSTITIKNEKSESNISGAELTVIPVTGRVLSEAKEELESTGFINVREEPYGKIWNRANWIVMEQSIEAGTVTDKSTEIELSCISLDDYFNDAYAGKNIWEIQQHAAENGFELRFEDDSSENLTEKVAVMDMATKESWIATKARQYAFSSKIALVTVKNTREEPEPENDGVDSESDPEPVPDQPPTPTTPPKKEDSVYYSTNDSKTAREGKSGVFAYKKDGPTVFYYIIDFDEGYVYYFTDGNGSDTVDRLKIDFGNLNDGLKYTYHDGDQAWSEWLHFRWNKQPDHLIFVDASGNEWDFYPTGLDKALEIKNQRRVIDY